MACDPVEFCLIVERGPLEAQAILLSQSIRAFGGRYARAPITAVSPRADWRPADDVRRKLIALGVNYRAEDLLSPAPDYGTSYRVLAAGMLGREPGPPVLVQLDSDTVFVGEPDLRIGDDLLLARPVDGIGMCSTGPGDPRDALWQAMCAANGITVDQLGWVETTVGGTRVRSAYNGGLIAARRALFVETEAVFNRIVAAGLRSRPNHGRGIRIGAGAVGARGYAWWGTSQAAIAIAAARLGGTRRLLGPEHNLPMHLIDDIRDTPARPVHLHYHWLFENARDTEQALAHRVMLERDKALWLRERLPLAARTIEGTGVFSPQPRTFTAEPHPTAAPACSVVMTVFRDVRFLNEAVASVLAQGFTDFELIVVDDGSPDPAPVAALAALDPRIRTLRLERNRGTAEAANEGIAIARGAIIARLDSDDAAEPGWLGQVMAALAQDPGLGLVGSAVTMIDPEGGALGVQAMPECDFAIRFTMLFHNPFYHSTTAFRRDLFTAAGGYRADQPVSQDHYLWFAMLPLCRARNLPQPLVRYRMNPDGLTRVNGGHHARGRTAEIRSALWREIGIVPPAARLALAAEADNMLRGRRGKDRAACSEASEIIETALRRVELVFGPFVRSGEEHEARRFAASLYKRLAVDAASPGILLGWAARRARQWPGLAGAASALRRRGKALQRSLFLRRPRRAPTSNVVLEALHEVSPYLGFDPAAVTEDLQGWGSNDPVFRMLIAELRPRLIVEVGSWKGASAIHMAALCREFGLDSTVVCVDTWLGSSEHALGRRPEWRQSLRPRHGYPQLYYTFLSNVMRSGYDDTIVPLPNTSDHAAVILRAKDLRPDLVYIDASHDEAAVSRDLETYWALLRPGGALIGDDFAKFPGVRRAAQRFAVAVQEPIEDYGDKFVLRRGNPAVAMDVP